MYDPAGGRPTSSDCLAGVDVPDAVIDGCLLRLPAAAARSADACETPACGTLVVLPPWTCVDAFVVPLLVLSELDDL